jgi:hypothetical protein
MPRTPEVGAAIGLAALLLGLAAAVATDATDLIVRGPRHVAAAGGELVAVLPRDPSVAAAGPLATAVLEVREPGVPLLLALATAGRDARRSNAWTDAIARALVSEGVGVLASIWPRGAPTRRAWSRWSATDVRLADAVSFEPGLKLAQLSAGRDHADALVALTELPGRLPRDLDIMLVSLPTAASRSVVAAATALDHVLVVVERDRTSRVDLIASLDALEAAGTHAQAVLLDTQTALRLAPPVEAAPETQDSRKRAISSTVGTAPVVTPGSDGEPVPVPDDEGALDVEEEQEPAASDDELVAAEVGRTTRRRRTRRRWRPSSTGRHRTRRHWGPSGLAARRRTANWTRRCRTRRCRTDDEVRRTRRCRRTILMMAAVTRPAAGRTAGSRYRRRRGGRRARRHRLRAGRRTESSAMQHRTPMTTLGRRLRGPSHTEDASQR